MAVLNIVHYGDPILRKKCAPVKDFSILGNLLDDMFDTMYEAEGIVLAANQVNLNLSLFIIDITHTEEADEPNIFINPEITAKAGDENIYPEGCLSFPGITLDVVRPEQISLKYQTPDEIWHEDEYTAVGFPRVFYLKYHGYSSYFPLWAIARYRFLKDKNNNDKPDYGI